MYGHLVRARERLPRFIWCVLGDFNSVLNRANKKGVSIVALNSALAESLEFEDFIEVIGLMDLPLSGKRFTWFHSNGISMIRMDRILLSVRWEEEWGQRNFGS